MYNPFWSHVPLPSMFVPGCDPVDDDDDGDIVHKKPTNKCTLDDGDTVHKKPTNKCTLDDGDTVHKKPTNRCILDSSCLFQKPTNKLTIEQLNAFYNNNFFRPRYIREWGAPPSRDTTRVDRRMHRTQDVENLQSSVVGNPKKIPEKLALVESGENNQEFKDVENLQSTIVGNPKKVPEKLALVESIENNQEFKDVENLQSFVIGNPKKIPEKLALVESCKNYQEFKDVENLQSPIVGNPKKIPEKLEKFLKDFAEAHSGARNRNMKNKKMKSKTTEKNEGVKECDDVSISSASEKDQDINEQTIDKLARLNSFEEETFPLTKMDSGDKFQTVVSKKKKQPLKIDSRSFDSRNITCANQNTVRSNPVQKFETTPAVNTKQKKRSRRDQK